MVFFCFAALVGLSALIVKHFISPVRTYAVADVQAGLRQQPHQWAGRIIRIRGSVDLWWGHGCPATQISPCHYTAGIYLRPDAAPKWSNAWAGHVLAQTFALGSRLGVISGELRIPGTRPDLLIVSSSWGKTSATMPSSLQEPEPRLQQLLPTAAYSAPMIGPILIRLLPPTLPPWVVVRVRLNDPRSCPARAHKLCPDGVAAGM